MCEDFFFLDFFSGGTSGISSASDEFSVVEDSGDDESSLGGRRHSGGLGFGRGAGGRWPLIESEDCIDDCRGLGVMYPCGVADAVPDVEAMDVEAVDVTTGSGAGTATDSHNCSVARVLSVSTG